MVLFNMAAGIQLFFSFKISYLFPPPVGMSTKTSLFCKAARMMRSCVMVGKRREGGKKRVSPSGKKN